MGGGIRLARGATNRLSDRQVQVFITKARAGTAPRKKLADGGGLFITLTPAGTPVWRVRYRFNGSERLASPGVYPSVGLAEARAARELLHGQLRAGLDPSIANRMGRTQKATFREVSSEWLEMRRKTWSRIHYVKTMQAIERDVYPRIGHFRIADLNAALVAPVVQAIVNRDSVETAGKVLQNVSRIFRYAEAKGLCSGNPAVAVKELLPPQRHSQRPALLDFLSLRGVLRGAEVVPISPAVRMAHRLIAFSAARIGNVITADWSELDLDGDTPTWTIPREKMKMKDRDFDHKVILGPTITAELRQWRRATGGTGYVFPSPTGRAHITHESLEKVYRVTLKLAGKHSPHGWRSAFSTLARENSNPFSREAVELALDHVADNAIVRAYDRGERLEERVRLMYWWDAALSDRAAE